MHVKEAIETVKKVTL